LIIAPDRTIAQKYTELGQLFTKNRNCHRNSDHELQYSSWLLGSITPIWQAANNASNLGESIFMIGFTTNKLDGNIAGTRWKAYGDGIDGHLA
jgi:hypothetical protein